VAKQKHFLVSRVIQPELPTDPIEIVETEAVISKALQAIAWRELQHKREAKCSVNFFLKKFRCFHIHSPQLIFFNPADRIQSE
jgi:hypothetical protein